MKSLTIASSLFLLVLCAFVLTGCVAGSGYSSIGVSYGNYWGSYPSYRAGYNYNYRYSNDYRRRDIDRSKIGRPRHQGSGGQHRSRPQVRSSGGRSVRR